MSWFESSCRTSRDGVAFSGKKTNDAKDMRVFRNTRWPRPRYNRKREWSRSSETWTAWLRICFANGHEGMAQSYVSRHKMKHGAYLFCTRGLIKAVMRPQGWYAQPSTAAHIIWKWKPSQNMRDRLRDVIKDELKKNNKDNTFDSSQGSMQIELNEATEWMLYLTINHFFQRVMKQLNQSS